MLQKYYNVYTKSDPKLLKLLKNFHQICHIAFVIHAYQCCIKIIHLT